MYLTLFKTFFKIGIVTFGGGYAMIPMIKADVVDKYKWIGEEEFLDLLAVAQSCPGVFAINISVFIGYKLRRLKGAVCTAFGTALPSFLIILAIGIRPAVVALIAVPTFELAKSAKIGLANCWIPIGGALLIWLLGVNPIYVIIAAGLGGYIYGRFLKTTE